MSQVSHQFTYEQVLRNCGFIPNGMAASSMDWELDLELVEALVQAYPEALITGVDDVYGSGHELAPLMFACRRSATSVDLLKLLTDPAKECLRVEDCWGRLPIQALFYLLVRSITNTNPS
jgi:hypothetical protein